MVYLTTHSTHLRLYGVRHIVKDHSDCERGNPLLQHEILLPICYHIRGALAGTRNDCLDAILL